jgi:hypothetical protein
LNGEPWKTLSPARSRSRRQIARFARVCRARRSRHGVTIKALQRQRNAAVQAPASRQHSGQARPASAALGPVTAGPG